MGDTTLDIFGSDPTGTNNLVPRRNLLGTGGPPAGPKFAEPSEEEAAPLRDRLLHKTVSGLNYIGSSLDKAFGARAIRGVAAGKPREALSVIPFSDTLGATKPEDSVSMDQLLTDHLKLIRPNDPDKWEFRDFAVPALEIAADPGTYINPFGAYTKAGKLASGLGHTQGMSRKALTKGFDLSESALKAAGHSADDIAHLSNQGSHVLPESLEQAAKLRGVDLGVGTPLRGSLGFGMPFRDAAGAVGTGKGSQSLAGFMDDAVKSIKAAPGVRNVRALLDPNAMRADHAGVAQAAESAGRPATEKVRSGVAAAEYDLRTTLDSVMKNFAAVPGAENEALRLVRGSVERAGPHFANRAAWLADFNRRHATVLSNGNRLTTGVTDPTAVANHIATHWDTLQGMADRTRSFGESVLDDAAEHGLNQAALHDTWVHYGARRYIGATPGFGGTKQGKQFPAVSGSNMRRRAALSDIPGGSEQINEWAINPDLVGAGALPFANKAKSVFADMERNALAGMPAGSVLDAGTAKKLQGKSREVAKWLESVDEAHAAGSIPYFNPDIIGDYTMRGTRHAKVMGSSAALVRGSVDMSRPVADFVADNEKHVKLGDFLNHNGQAGLTTTLGPRITQAEQAEILRAGFSDLNIARTVASNPAIAKPPELVKLAKLSPALATKLTQDTWHGAGVKAYEQMAKRGFGPVADVIAGHVNPVQALNQYALSEHDAGALSRFLQGWTAPTETHPFLSFMSGAQNFFKNSVYPIWPASHFRNALSAVYNNFIHGTGLEDYADALKLLKGHGLDGAKYGLAGTPEEVAHALKRGAYADGKVFAGINSFEDHVGGRGLGSERLAKGLSGDARLAPKAPGVHDETLGAAMSKPGWWNPLAQQGVLGHTEDAFAPLVLGRRVGTGIEDYVRLSNYLGNLRRGMSSDRAGMLTRAIHFDYTDLTPFEKNVMKNVVPFYTFMRNNLPFQLKMAATEPNKVSPLLRMMGMDDPTGGEWRPEYLSSGAATPLGPEDENGTRRYLSKFGLPIEEAGERLKFRDYELPWGQHVTLPSPSQTLMSFAGSANPLLKTPVEMTFGTQLHTGRKLADLYAKGVGGGYGLIPQEYAQPATELLANSPLARFASTADQAAQVYQGRKSAGDFLTNFFTGFKLSDVDLAKQRAVVERQELERSFTGDPRVAKFTNFYPRAEAEAAGLIDPELARRFGLFTRIKKDAKAYNEAKKEKAALLPKWGGL